MKKESWGIDINGENYGRLVKYLRLFFNMSQRAMSRCLGVPVSTYKSWELEKCIPCFDNHKKILAFAENNLGKEFSSALDKAFVLAKL